MHAKFAIVQIKIDKRDGVLIMHKENLRFLYLVLPAIECAGARRSPCG